MTKERLSKVYLDDYPITLMGDEATPPLSRIVRAGGKRPDDVDVLFLRSPSDAKGRPVDPEEIIDRSAEPTRPIYLRTVARESKPIHTADPGHALSRPDLRKALGSAAPMLDVDPVIAQLGGAPKEGRPPHEAGVFRSPAQAGAEAAALRAAALAKAAASAKASASQAAAEAEAEQRQEEERNQEDALQDEQEARREAGEDAETQR